jgi:facilitated trehalose transporter
MTNLKPLAISLMLMVGRRMSGINAVIFYSVNIFESAHTSLNPFVENIIVGFVMVFATGLAAVFIDRLGRRMLLIISLPVTIIALYFLGLYFWIQKNHPALAETIDFLPLVTLCLFIFAFSVGIGPISFLMMSELFAPELKGIDSAISSKIYFTKLYVLSVLFYTKIMFFSVVAFNWGLAFLVIQFYKPVSIAVGMAATFWGFASILVLVMTFVLFFVPETKGRSLEEIQELFKTRPSMSDDEAPILNADNDTLEANVEDEINAEINTVLA